MKLYNVTYSGNSYKVRLLLNQLGIRRKIVIEIMICAFHERFFVSFVRFVVNK